MFFEVVSPILGSEPFAVGHSIRDLDRLTQTYGGKNWKKMKGFAKIRLQNNIVWYAELHWYEAHGVGKVEMKVKRLLQREG